MHRSETLCGGEYSYNIARRCCPALQLNYDDLVLRMVVIMSQTEAVVAFILRIKLNAALISSGSDWVLVLFVLRRLCMKMMDVLLLRMDVLWLRSHAGTLLRAALRGLFLGLLHPDNLIGACQDVQTEITGKTLMHVPWKSVKSAVACRIRKMSCGSEMRKSNRVLLHGASHFILWLPSLGISRLYIK